MKKLITMVALVAAGMAFAEDSYLYWQVDQSEDASPIAFSYAQITDGGGVVVGTGSDRFLIANGATSAGPINTTWTPGTAVDDDWVCVVQLIDEQGVVAALHNYTYGDLKSYIFTNGAQQGAQAFSASGFTAVVPEPTSGLLLLLGLAGLALKRKNAKN